MHPSINEYCIVLYCTVGSAVACKLKDVTEPMLSDEYSCHMVVRYRVRVELKICNPDRIRTDIISYLVLDVIILKLLLKRRRLK